MEVKEIGQPKMKEEITEYLSVNGLSYIPITYYGCHGLFVSFEDSEILISHPEFP